METLVQYIEIVLLSTKIFVNLTIHKNKLVFFVWPCYFFPPFHKWCRLGRWMGTYKLGLHIWGGSDIFPKQICCFLFRCFAWPCDFSYKWAGSRLGQWAHKTYTCGGLKLIHQTKLLFLAQIRKESVNIKKKKVQCFGLKWYALDIYHILLTFFYITHSRTTPEFASPF